MTVRYLLSIFRLLLLVLWTPTLAMAAMAVTLQKTLSDVPGLVLLIVAGLSTLSGATALVMRIDRELRDKPGTTLLNPALFVSAHMLGSWLAGALAFIIAEGQNFNDWAELGFVITASFTGAKFIETIAEKYLARALPPESPKG